MTLCRKNIRTALIERLRGKTAAEDRVFENKATPLFSQEPPAILVYALDEEVDFFTKSPRVYRHRLRVAIELAVVEESSIRLDAHIDDLSEQIIRLLEADRELGGTCEDLYLQRFEMALGAEGKQLAGGARLTYEIVYLTEQGESDPDALTPLASVGLNWDLAPPDGTLEAEDILALQNA